MIFLKEHYFKFGLGLGLVLAGLIGLLMLKSSFWELFQAQGKGALIPILVAIVGMFFLALKLDQSFAVDISDFFNNAILKPVILFLTGALVGVITHFLMKTHSDISLGDQFFSWFVKPLFGIGSIGILASIGLGSIYFFTFGFFLNQNLK